MTIKLPQDPDNLTPAHLERAVKALWKAQDMVGKYAGVDNEKRDFWFREEMQCEDQIAYLLDAIW